MKKDYLGRADHIPEIQYQCVYRFFCFWGTLVGLQIYSASLYRLLGTTLRSLVLGTSVAVIVMLLTMLGSGFLILRKQMPAGWS